MPAQNIFAQFAEPMKSVTDYQADYDAQDLRKERLAGERRTNAIAALTQQQSQQAMAEAAADRNALQAIAGGWNAQTTADQRVAALRNSGRPSLMKQADDLEKQSLERGKLTSENAKRDTETENAVVTMWRDMIGNAANPQQAAQMVTAMHSDPRIANTPIARVPLEQGLQMLQQVPFDQWKQQFALGAAKFVEMNRPQYMQSNLGGTSRITALPGLGGAPAVASEAPITQSADNRANNARMAADAAAGRAQSADQFNRRLAYDQGKDAAKAEAPPKPLPPGALKMQQESLDAIGISSSINADLGGIAQQIEGGKLSFGPVDNLVNAGRNMAGISSEKSRNFASFKSTLERLRNESLRLNAGVQTDGDAQRAWNELFQNINDTELVKQRLGEIQNINKRGAELHQLRIDSVRNNYNAGPLDASAYKAQPAAVGATAGPPKVGAVVDGYRFKGGNPADKANWEKQ